MNKGNNEDTKLNKILKIVGIILIITIIITLFIILNKGKIFGFRLVEISDDIEEEHTISIVIPNEYIFVDDEETEFYVTIDGEDVTEGYEIIVSDEDVVSIDDNMILALQEGVVTITAISNDYDIQAETTISVVEPITKLSIESEYSQIDIGEETQISYEYEPEEATVNIEYSSSDEDVATVDENGIVTGVSEGTATIIATDSITGKTASCSITVDD